MSRFSRGEIEAFFSGDPVRVEDCLSIFNMAHDLRPDEALSEVQLLLASAPTEREVAIVAAGPLEALLDLHYHRIDALFSEALVNDARLRQALRGADTSQVPKGMRERWDAIAATTRD